MKFYVCEHCGNIITFEKSSGVPVVCCGEQMKELVPGSVDAVVEKHVPDVTVDGNKVSVQVGSTAHPMLAEHYIEWIILETEQGSQKKILHPDDAPAAEFLLTDGDKAVAVYEHCNIHGLWKKDL